MVRSSLRPPVRHPLARTGEGRGPDALAHGHARVDVPGAGHGAFGEQRLEDGVSQHAAALGGKGDAGALAISLAS